MKIQKMNISILECNTKSQWVYLRLILSAQWFVEDKGNPEMPLKRASYIYMLLEE